MTTLLILTAAALFAVAFSVWRAGWRGDFGWHRVTGFFVGILCGVCSVGAGAAIFLAIGGV